MRLAENLVEMDQVFESALLNRWPGLRIISGHRDPAQNRAAGGVVDSRHLRCPSEAADLRVGSIQGLDSPQVWQMLGGYWKLLGGRWGGDFRQPDQNHFDLG